jgi:hypothetical protein
LTSSGANKELIAKTAPVTEAQEKMPIIMYLKTGVEKMLPDLLSESAEELTLTGNMESIYLTLVFGCRFLRTIHVPETDYWFYNA